MDVYLLSVTSLILHLSLHCKYSSSLASEVPHDRSLHVHPLVVSHFDPFKLGIPARNINGNNAIDNKFLGSYLALTNNSNTVHLPDGNGHRIIAVSNGGNTPLKRFLGSFFTTSNSGNAVTSSLDNKGVYIIGGNGHEGFTVNSANDNSQRKFIGSNLTSTNGGNAITSSLDNKGVYVIGSNSHKDIADNSGNDNSQDKILGSFLATRNSSKAFPSNSDNSGVMMNGGTGHDAITVNHGNNNAQHDFSGKMSYLQTRRENEINNWIGKGLDLTDPDLTAERENSVDAVTSTINNGSTMVKGGTDHGELTVKHGNNNAEKSFYSKTFYQQINDDTSGKELDRIKDDFQLKSRDRTLNTHDRVPGSSARAGNSGTSSTGNNRVIIGGDSSHGSVTVNQGNDNSEHNIFGQENYHQSFLGSQTNSGQHVFVVNLENRLNFLDSKLSSKPYYTTATEINREVEKIDAEINALETQSLSPDLLKRIQLIKHHTRVLRNNIIAVVRNFVNIPLENQINKLIIHLKNAQHIKLTRMKSEIIQDLESELEALKLELHYSNDPKVLEVLQPRLKALEEKLSFVRRWNVSNKLNAEVGNFESFFSKFGNNLHRIFHRFTGHF